VTWRPNPNTAIALLALVLAIGGGTAFALEGHNTVFSDDIAPGEVRTSDIDADAMVAEAPRNVQANPLGPSDPCQADQTRIFCGYEEGSQPSAYWSNTGGAYGPVAFYKDPASTVHLSGVAKASGPWTTTTMFILPPAYRPSARRAFTAPCWDFKSGYDHCVVLVGSGGRVSVGDRDATSGGLSLDGISFRAG
jgi:hypothetical protein